MRDRSMFHRKPLSLSRSLRLPSLLQKLGEAAQIHSCRERAARVAAMERFRLK